MIKTENICKAYEKPVLDKVNAIFAGGETVGIYGESGCGKSTFAKILCGVERADKGELTVDDITVFSESQKYNRKVGKAIQYVYQQPFASLDPVQKIGDSLTELIRYNKIAKSQSEARGIARRAAEEMGIKREVLESLPSEISGGEAQRVAIIKCLLLNPKMIILDEATSMLDVSTQANVLAKVKEIQKKSNLTVLIISHDRNLVEAFCDRIYYFEECGFKEK